MFTPHQDVKIPMMPRCVPAAVPVLLSFVAGYIDEHFDPRAILNPGVLFDPS
jgi:hypothetical protein